MNNGCCFVETTVLAEALLKISSRRKKAVAMIDEYPNSILPVYAIKELKAGPLLGYRFAHDKLIEMKSFIEVRNWLDMQYPTYKKGSAQEALNMGEEATLEGLEIFHGSRFASSSDTRSVQEKMADSVRYHIRRRIQIAWRNRKRITKRVSNELSCFAESAPWINELTGFYEDDRLKCDVGKRCCLALGFSKRRGDLRKLKTAIKGSTSDEDGRRRKILYQLLDREPKKVFFNEECKHLGDAIFALQCPNGCDILTTNIKDLKKLGTALKKNVRQLKLTEKQTAR